jgi:amino acid transporter
LKDEPQLARALTLRDLVLFNLVAVVGITWVTAVKAGPGSLALWLLAALLFFIPQGLAVVQLSSSSPEEGGIYAWTRKEFGAGHGFLCGWCYWVNDILFYPTLLLSISTSAAYIFGRGESGLVEDWTYVLPFTLSALVVAVMLNIMGVGTGRWLQNAGGAGVYLIGIILILLGLYAMLHKPAANPLSLRSLVPDLTNLPMLNLWATIAFAFAGLELSATMGREIVQPRRNLPRSIYIAGPLVALLYVCGTLAILWLVPSEELNIVAGPLQAIQSGVRSLGPTLGPTLAWVLPLCAVLLTLGRLGALGAWLTGSARVAFMVGLDQYFPQAFARVHPRWRTPYVAIIVQAALATFFLLLSVLGKGTSVVNAFLILLDMSLLLYFIPYLYLFACFIAHCRRSKDKKGLLVPGGRMGGVLAGLCGLFITLLAMGVTMIPPPETREPLIYEAKVWGSSALLVLCGGLIYRAKRKSRKAEASFY